MLKKMNQLLLLSSLSILSIASSASTPAATTNPMNGQPLPTTQQLMNQCENNTASPNCQQIVQQAEATYQAQQASLQNQVNQNPPPSAPIPKQPGPGSNPTQQPNY